MLVHLFGYPAEIFGNNANSKKDNLKIIEEVVKAPEAY